MAEFNEILAGRFNRFLQKWLSMKGPPAAAALTPEILTVFNWPLADPLDDAMRAWFRYGALINVPPTVGQGSTIRLRNPSTSNVGAELILIRPFSQGTSTVLVTLNRPIATDVGVANLAPVVALDGRIRPSGITGPSAIVNSGGVGGLATPLIDQWSLPAAGSDVSLRWTSGVQSLPLLPGDAIDFLSQTLNQALILSIWWRERQLEESERVL